MPWMTGLKLPPQLRTLETELELFRTVGEPIRFEALHSPLPRAYEWVDGSAYVNHVVLVRQARKPNRQPHLGPTHWSIKVDRVCSWHPPRTFLCCMPIGACDFEAEICVVLGDTPSGNHCRTGFNYIQLVLLCNDVTLRNLIPNNLAKSFASSNPNPPPPSLLRADS